MAPKRPARERLRALRDKHGLSSDDFGSIVGCSGSAILRYESTDPDTARVPKTLIAHKLHKISKKLGDPISPLDWCS